jgi:transcriptional regulator with XRE-family HTH domain
MAKGKYEEWLKPEGLLLIEGWARDGLTDEQIAHNIDISRSTLSEWKKNYSDISDALKRGKEVVDRMVENALLKRALGYQYDEVTYEQVSCKPYEDEHGNIREHVLEVTKKVIKEVHPDTTAQIFWLKNRKPSEWRDKQIMEHEGQQTFSIKLPGDLSGD